MMTTNDILTAFFNNAAQFLLLSIILVVNRQRNWLYKKSIFVGIGMNGLGALLYVMPGKLSYAIFFNNTADSLFLFGILISYLMKHTPTRGERIAIIILFIISVVSTAAGLIWFFYAQEREREARLSRQAIVKVDSLSGDVNELKGALADSSSARAEQVLTNRVILYRILGIVQAIQQQQNKPKPVRQPARRGKAKAVVFVQPLTPINYLSTQADLARLPPSPK